MNQPSAALEHTEYRADLQVLYNDRGSWLALVKRACHFLSVQRSCWHSEAESEGGALAKVVVAAIHRRDQGRGTAAGLDELKDQCESR